MIWVRYGRRITGCIIVDVLFETLPLKMLGRFSVLFIIMYIGL